MIIHPTTETGKAVLLAKKEIENPNGNLYVAYAIIKSLGIDVTLKTIKQVSFIQFKRMVGRIKGYNLIKVIPPPLIPKN